MLVSLLGLMVACGYIPSEEDDTGEPDPPGSSGEESGMESDDPPPPPPPMSTSDSGEGSHTGVVTTDTGGSTTDEPGTDEGDTGGTETTDDGGEDTGTTGEPVDPCEVIDRACATFTSGSLTIFQMGDGTILDTIPIPFETYQAHSITWVGDYVYACAGEPQTLKQIDVTTGVINDSPLQCSGVSDSQGSLLVRVGDFMGDYAYYDDFAAAVADTPSSVTNYPPSVHRITATDDLLLSSWHSTDHFEVFELATGVPQGDVPFEMHDHWVMGMDVVEGNVIIGTWFSEPLRHIAFDLETGLRTCEMPSVGGSLDNTDGLACFHIPDVEPPPPPPPPM